MMSYLSELLKILDSCRQRFNEYNRAAMQVFDDIEREHALSNNKTNDLVLKKHVSTLLSIDEDTALISSEPDSKSSDGKSSSENNNQVPKKRSKDEVDDMPSPEKDKRQKRNASVKAQNVITKQVNVNLHKKLRREASDDTQEEKSSKIEKKDDEIIPNIQIKQEKISLPTVPLEVEETLPLRPEIKLEEVKDDFAMPPPIAPISKSRKKKVIASEQADVPNEEPSGRTRRTRTKKNDDVTSLADHNKENVKDINKKSLSSEEELPRSRRTTKSKKKNDIDMMPPPSGRSTRATRASARATRHLDDHPPAEHTEHPEPAETAELTARPKRTRAKKKQEEADDKDAVGESVPSTIVSPANKRPKRTRKGQKAIEKELLSEESQTKELEPEEILINPPKSRIPLKTPEPQIPVNQPEPNIPIEPPEPEISDTIPQKTNSLESKILDQDIITLEKNNSPILISKVIKTQIKDAKSKLPKQDSKEKSDEEKSKHEDKSTADKLKNMENVALDQTIVLTNGVYNHEPVTPQIVRPLDETVVLEKCSRETIVLENKINDATVVIDKGEDKEVDSSLLTDDDSHPIVVCNTPPPRAPPQAPPQPTSAVKERVQQFEEMLKATKPTTKLVKNMSSSATKPQIHVPTKPMPASASKVNSVSSVARARDEREERLKTEREDARIKKQAILEAKRELQKRKREEKMAAAAATRSAAERERALAVQAAVRERREKERHVDLERLERVKEAERKKQELARKVAETEERRKCEEAARAARLAAEQRRADELRRKQEEAEAMKKEEHNLAKEMEKRNREYKEKQKLKQKMASNKMLTPVKYESPRHMEPTYMMDGFQYLHSDEEIEDVVHPVPIWSTSSARHRALVVQAAIPPALVSRLFLSHAHTPDLREIFPAVDRRALKRTSSAVWRTPIIEEGPV